MWRTDRWVAQPSKSARLARKAGIGSGFRQSRAEHLQGSADARHARGSRLLDGPGDTAAVRVPGSGWVVEAHDVPVVREPVGDGTRRVTMCRCQTSTTFEMRCAPSQPSGSGSVFTIQIAPAGTSRRGRRADRTLPVAARKDAADLARQEPLRSHASEELADVLLYLVRLADVLGIDLRQAADRKLSNAAKHPAAVVRSPPVQTRPNPAHRRTNLIRHRVGTRRLARSTVGAPQTTVLGLIVEQRMP